MTSMREWKAVGLGASIVAIYLALVLLSGRVDLDMFGRLLAFYIRTSFALWVFLGGCAILFAMVQQGRQSGNQPFLARFAAGIVRDRWQRDHFASMIWPPLLFATLLASFNAFKQMVLPIAGFGWDPMLAAADRALFFGTDPWRLTHALFGSPQATALIDSAYHGWFVPMSLGLIACAWMPRSTFRLRTQYMLSYIAVWIGIGSVLAFLMPSAGPCFYENFIGPEPGFRDLLSRLGEAEAATGGNFTSLRNQEMLVKLFGADKLIVGGGISAMPSVHNGLAALFALAAWQINRTAGMVVWVYAALIWLGSIHLGWHYALDGIIAIALTYGIWIACGRVAALLDRNEGVPAPVPALA